MKRPNNFPREGQHNMVTKDAIEKLERDRPNLNHEVHYTMGGTVETQVHSTLMAEREGAITRGARCLNTASKQLQKGIEAAKPDARTEYIRKHREAAAIRQQRIKTIAR